MHDSLLQTDNQGLETLIKKYEQECQIMANLRHPNITQFLGICYLPDIRLPLLVMEQLDMSLDDLLEYVSNLPLTLKVLFLEDVSRGLDYLHKRDPPIIHRDLTAKNVLLTSSLSAKITDMGNSSIVSMRPGQLARTLSQLPGTLVYMPPEALGDDHRYGPSLDIFSLGHLALYTLTQVRIPKTIKHVELKKGMGTRVIEEQPEHLTQMCNCNSHMVCNFSLIRAPVISRGLYNIKLLLYIMFRGEG